MAIMVKRLQGQRLAGKIQKSKGVEDRMVGNHSSFNRIKWKYAAVYDTVKVTPCR